jgi:hypothetical protein
MTLKFNPFEKDQAAPVPKTKKANVVPQITGPDKCEIEVVPLLPPPTWASEEQKTSTKAGSLNGLQTGDKQTTKPVKQATQRTTTRLQTDHKTDYKQSTNKPDFSLLVGHERKLLLFIFNECRATGALTTPPVSLAAVKETLKARTGSTAKTILSRLIDKKFILRGEGKTGRGGWMTFSLEREIFQRLLIETDYKKATNSLQTDHKEATQRTTQRTTNASSSSGGNLDLRTTRTSETESALPTEWAAIDVTQLATIGFTQTHVRQIHRAGLLTPEELQDSIDAFAFDLEVNGKAKALTGPPLNFFMGCLRRGPYAPAENYEAPEVRQRRLYLEAKEKQAKARRELEDKIEALEFEEWSGKLTPAQRAEFVPPTDFARPGSTAHNVELRRYFREQVWPEKRKFL